LTIKTFKYIENNGAKNELDPVPLWTDDKKRKSLAAKEFETKPLMSGYTDYDILASLW
jgi:hypothetical protein